MSNYSTYTTDYPQHIAPSSFTIFSTALTTSTTTQSLKRLVSSRGGQRFGLKFNYAPMTKEEFLPLWAFLVKQSGQFGTFTVAMPNQECRGSLSTQANEVLQVNANTTGGNTITIKNFNTSQSNVVKVGDYVKFGSSSKLYIVTDDVNSDGSGLGTLSLYPNIIGTVSENTQVYFEPVMNVGLTEDNLQADIPSDMTYNFNVEFIERT